MSPHLVYYIEIWLYHVRTYIPKRLPTFSFCSPNLWRLRFIFFSRQATTTARLLMKDKGRREKKTGNMKWAKVSIRKEEEEQDPAN